MKNLLVLLSVITLFSISTGCSKTSEQPFNQFGISFTCPSGWKIDEATEMDPGYYISVEKSGINSSGILSIMMIEEETDLQDFLAVFEEGITSQSLYGQLKMSDVVENKYGKYSGIGKQYTANIMTLPHEGRMYAFTTNGKTVYVVEQEATEDKKKNANGFKVIRESLMIE